MPDIRDSTVVSFIKKEKSIVPYLIVLALIFEREPDFSPKFSNPPVLEPDIQFLYLRNNSFQHFLWSKHVHAVLLTDRLEATQAIHVGFHYAPQPV